MGRGVPAHILAKPLPSGVYLTPKLARCTQKTKLVTVLREARFKMPNIKKRKNKIKLLITALAAVAQWIECRPVNQSHGFDSQLGH